MDEQGQEELLRKQRLEAERQKLTDEQREQHDLFCQDLKARQVYRDDEATKAARVIRTEEGVHRASELRKIIERCEYVAADERRRAQAEAERLKEHLAEKAERQSAARAQDIENYQRQDLKRQAQDAQKLAAHEAASREPIPGTVERFDGLLAASKEQAQQQRDAEAASRSNPDSGTPLWKAQAGAESAIQTYIGLDAACESHWDSSANPNNIPLEKLTERREEARLSMLGALAPLTDAKIIEVLTKNPITDHDGELFLAATIGEIEANRVKAFASPTPAQETDKQQPKLETPTGPTPEFGTPLWKAQAATLDRQRHQFGRYDFPPNTPPSDGASAPVLPSPDPPNPPTPARADSPLTANEILARHTNPELEARFQREQQQRADQKKAATPEAVVQNNAPTGKRHETGLMADFVTPATKKKAAEEEAARTANPSQSFGRGGGRGR